MCVFFANKARSLRRKGKPAEPLGSCETVAAEVSIKDAAKTLQDSSLLATISCIDLIANQCKYHHSCRNNYIKRAHRMLPPPVCVQPRREAALNGIRDYIQNFIIENNRPELLSSVYSRYLTYCDDLDETPFSNAQSFMRAIIDRFKGKLKSLSTSAKKQGVILYYADTADDSVRIAYDFTSSIECTVTKAALLLRKAIKEIKKNEFPRDPTVADIIKGEASPPEISNLFFRVLYGGLDVAKHNSKVCQLANSSSQDALFMTTRGRVKPEKHVSLGVALKSLTGSKKVITYLNKLGHCVNYHCIEELETALGSSLVNQQSLLPEGTLKNLSAGLAFDNTMSSPIPSQGKALCTIQWVFCTKM